MTPEEECIRLGMDNYLYASEIKDEYSLSASIYKINYIVKKLNGVEHEKFIRNRLDSKFKYTQNENLWSDRSLEACYWAGFLAADGSIFTNSGGVRKTLSLCLKEREQVQKYADFVTENYTAKLDRRSSGRVYYYCRFAINEKWENDLKNIFSITPRKTKSLQPPNLNTDLQEKAFLYGFIDGDGCLLNNKNCNSFNINTIGASESFMSWVYDSFIKYYGVTHIYRYERKGTPLIEVNMSPDASHAMIAECQKPPFITLPLFDRKWKNPLILESMEKRKPRSAIDWEGTDVVKMREIDGMMYKDIAKLTGINKCSIVARYRRAKLKEKGLKIT